MPGLAHQLQSAANWLCSSKREIMATQKQIEANRRNAQKSTGPRTLEGKAAVRLNALRHGMRARTVVLPGEDRQEFNQLCDVLEAEWQPRTATELFYLEQMAVSQWKLTRMEVGEADVYHEVEGATTQVPLLDRLWRAQYRMERSFARAQRELERIQASRDSRAPQLQEDFDTVDPQPLVADPDPVANFPNAANFPPKASSAPKPTPTSPQPAANELSFRAAAPGGRFTGTTTSTKTSSVNLLP